MKIEDLQKFLKDMHDQFGNIDVKLYQYDMLWNPTFSLGVGDSEEPIVVIN